MEQSLRLSLHAKPDALIACDLCRPLVQNTAGQVSWIRAETCDLVSFYILREGTWIADLKQAMSQRHQTAYSVTYGSDASSLNERVFTGMYEYLTNALGLPQHVAAERASEEVENRIGKNFCNECERLGIRLEAKTVLDLGCGLGGFALEAARRGAKVIAVEPGCGWREIAAKRLASEDAVVLDAFGEQLPVADNAVDLIVSLQVLEHVQDPKKVIEEAYRVLKPGGYFFFAYENYLGFWEPHYRVRWLPLLPKSVGSRYLRLLGRDPRFLNEAVTYTTFPAVRRYLRSTGFECTSVREKREALRSPSKTSLKWKALKAIAAVNAPFAIGLLTGFDFVRRMFKTAVYELVQKPRVLE